METSLDLRSLYMKEKIFNVLLTRSGNKGHRNIFIDNTIRHNAQEMFLRQITQGNIYDSNMRKKM